MRIPAIILLIFCFYGCRHSTSRVLSEIKFNNLILKRYIDSFNIILIKKGRKDSTVVLNIKRKEDTTLFDILSNIPDPRADKIERVAIYNHKIFYIVGLYPIENFLYVPEDNVSNQDYFIKNIRMPPGFPDKEYLYWRLIFVNGALVQKIFSNDIVVKLD